MNDNALDDLLNAPLGPVADDGFSARVMVRARKGRRKRQAPVFAALILCAAALGPFVPLPQIAAAIAELLAATAISPAVCLALTALALTFLAERALAQR